MKIDEEVLGVMKISLFMLILLGGIVLFFKAADALAEDEPPAKWLYENHHEPKPEPKERSWWEKETV